MDASDRTLGSRGANVGILHALHCGMLIVAGSAIAYRLFDVGYAIDLERALALLSASAPERVRPLRGEGQALQISNPPITVWLGGAALLRAGVGGWQHIPRAVRITGGVLTLWVAYVAICHARVLGINFLLSVMLLVWTADIAAYFAGRAFGLRFTKNKLAPSISPGKSWEGVWGGMLGVLLLALCWVAADAATQASVTSLYTRLAARGWWLLLLGMVFLAAMSVVGDLVESLVKRSVGVKDSSALLPGHGGVLDRIDALLPTVPLALMLVSL